MKTFSSLLTIISGLLLPGCILAAAEPVQPITASTHSVAVPVPRLFLWDATTLLAARASLARGEAPLQPALAKLRADAERALKLTPPSVMDKPQTAASGDKHDYFSYGPYWWPDPAKSGGLPYIRRDGEVNPTSRKDTDDVGFSRLGEAIESLGLAYWFTGEERYAEKAAQLARVWFLDPATRMNPNLQHAQAIPGLNDGRGIGIIESRRLATLNEAMSLLDGSPAWTANDRTALTTWLTAFYAWLTTSANGRDEHNERNNHGTWYDFQAAHLALVLGRTDEARKILNEGLTLRLAHQVQPDGSQPLELARTKSLDYSLMNLDGLFACATLAEHVGVDWWNFATPDGRSLHAALVYLAPYVDPGKVWPKKDLHAADRSHLVDLLIQYLQHCDDARFRELLVGFAPTAGANARWRLIRNQPLGAQPRAAVAAKPPAATDETPLTLPGSEPFVFRQVGSAELRLHMVKPPGWARGQARSCLVSFFGGGWNSGTPRTSVKWAEWAASHGLVGIAPDYRTRNRWGGTPEDCVSDGRAALRWIVAHAEELGIDSNRIIVEGGSAGAHVAAWTAISAPGPGRDDPAPSVLPIALILLNPVSDTKEGGYGGPKRFDGSAARALACSVPDQMPVHMPPTIVFHGTADATVPYANSVALRDKLVRTGNRCELITFEGLGHSYNSSKYGDAGVTADVKTKQAITAFLRSLGLITAAEANST